MIYRFDQFELDETEFQLTSPGGVLSLEPKALRVLLYLVKNSNRLVRKQEVLDSVWSEAFVSESTLTRTISLLRKALADDQREPRFIKTVPTQGYRFKFPVEVIDFPLQANGRFFAAVPKRLNLPPRSALPIKSRLGHPLWLFQSKPPSGSKRMACRGERGFADWVDRGVWILDAPPFRAHCRGNLANKPDPGKPAPFHCCLAFHFPTACPTRPISANISIAEEVATSLAQYSRLPVVSYTSSRNVSKSQAGIPQIALMLKVNDVLEGSVVSEGDQVAINLRLIDASNDSQLWSAQIGRSPDNLLGLQDQISRQIVQALRLPLSQRDRQRMGVMQTANPEAYDSYLRARYFSRSPQR